MGCFHLKIMDDITKCKWKIKEMLLYRITRSPETVAILWKVQTWQSLKKLKERPLLSFPRQHFSGGREKPLQKPFAFVSTCSRSQQTPAKFQNSKMKVYVFCSWPLSVSCWLGWGECLLHADTQWPRLLFSGSVSSRASEWPAGPSPASGLWVGEEMVCGRHKKWHTSLQFPLCRDNLLYGLPHMQTAGEYSLTLPRRRRNVNIDEYQKALPYISGLPFARSESHAHATHCQGEQEWSDWLVRCTNCRVISTIPIFWNSCPSRKNLPLSGGGICGFLLTNRMWQGIYDVIVIWQRF